MGEFAGLGFESRAQLGQGDQQLLDASVGGKLDGCGVGVVGGLRSIDMIIGVDHVVSAFGQSQVLECTVGDHLIGVHIRGGAGAALDHIDYKLLVQLAGNQIIAGLGDGGGLFEIDGAKLQIGLGRRLFDKGKRADQLGHVRDRVTGDGEVLHCACGMNTPIRVGRDGFDANEVMFLTH